VFVPVLLTIAQAGLVAVVPDGAAGCPSAAEVEQALYVRIPGAVIPFSEAGRRGALQLHLAPPSADGGRGFSLLDVGGQPRLSRSLGGAAGQKDCAALAETAALIVQRFLIELEDPVPVPAINSPLPVSSVNDGPDRRWDLSLSSGWQLGSELPGALQVGGRVGRLLGSSGRFLLAAGAAITGEQDLQPLGTGFTGRARARQFPVELGLWWRTLDWPVELQLGAGSGVDLTWVHASADGGNTETHLLPGPSVFAAAGLRVPLRRRTFLRLSGGIGGSVVTYRFSYSPQMKVDDLTIFKVPTQRIYVRIAADVGLTVR
jgi:hypothetical protein